MLRIAHISDLHVLADPNAQQATRFQRLSARFQKAFDVEVNIRGHSEGKLAALKNALRLLRPDVIAVTGDLSTYGDNASLRLAADILQELQEISHAQRMICVPGNHDSFGERMTALSKTNWLLVRYFKALQFLSKDLDNILKRGRLRPLLQAYNAEIAGRYGAPDPDTPAKVETGWGAVYFFPFDSTNDPGVMANEGRIGARQYARLRDFIDAPANAKELESALLIALLHHHPIPIPYLTDTAYERFYNSMRDGSTLCFFLNRRKFHFVLHGHQHQPHWCSLQYGYRGCPLNIIGAGTTLQESDAWSERDSFYILDILTPLQARLHMYQYRETGFDELTSAVDFDVVPLSGFKITPQGSPDGPEDIALRNLIKVTPDAVDETHKCEEIVIQAKVDPDQTYWGTYHFRGVCRSTRPVEALRHVITGSPAMKWQDMHLQARAM